MTSSATLPEMPVNAIDVGEKIAKQWAQVRMAHEAVMLEDAQAVLKQQRQLTANLPQQLASENIGNGAEKQGEGMVHIGDIQYVLPAPKAEPSAVSPAAVAPAAKSSVMPSLLKVGVGAALLATGAGLPFAIPVITSGIGGLFKPAAVAPAEPAQPGTVTINGHEYELGLEP